MSATGRNSKNGKALHKRVNATWEVGFPETVRRVEAAAMRREDHHVVLYDAAGEPVFATASALYVHRLPQEDPESVDVPQTGLKLPARDRL